MHPGDGQLQTRKRASREIRFPSSGLEFPAFRTKRNKCLLFKPPSVWYFVISASADQDKSKAQDTSKCCIKATNLMNEKGEK
jgi:hypothetical protein